MRAMKKMRKNGTHLAHIECIFRKRQINENDGKKMRKINIYTECRKAAAFQQPTI
jgi:hypothetical protein